MAPDRGSTAVPADPDAGGGIPANPSATSPSPISRSATVSSAVEDDETPPALIIEGRSFTLRGVAVGLLIGLVLVCANLNFGLQTGWVSSMTMPASLMGFGFFKMMSRHLKLPFSPVENVLVQTVAGSMGIMPLGCGLVGVVPSMNYLLSPSEQGPLNLSLWQLILWSLGLCYFGVVFAVPLRRQVIIREQLKFPSGFSTAVLISMLHGRASTVEATGRRGSIPTSFASLVAARGSIASKDATHSTPGDLEQEVEGLDHSWKRNVHLLLTCFAISGFFTLTTYFVPILRNLPVFGWAAANTWLWTLNPSLAYVGQGVIMGPATTIHMLLGAVVGWGMLSPLVKNRGWAPGPVDDWDAGSKGWIVWVSLAIMLADAVVSLGYLSLRPILHYTGTTKGFLGASSTLLRGLRTLFSRRPRGYVSVNSVEEDENAHPEVLPLPPNTLSDSHAAQSHELPDHDSLKPDGEDDAPIDQQINNGIVGIGLILSIVFCILCTHIVFGDLVPLYATITAVLMALLLSIMGVRALGETDLNPVSGISKLAQLFFALIIPQSNKSSVLINLVAGAVSEAGALQAGDLMQDLKTGHLLGAAPKAQFWGQVIGATVGAVASAFLYRLYTTVYEIPSDQYQIPTGYVWIFTARLVTGKGLPYMAREWAMGSAAVFAALTALRIQHTPKSKWHSFIPGGIAVAVGMYNVPSFTLARAIGGLFSWWWRSRRGWADTPLIVLASGFILGEGFLSIANLIMQSLRVPHL